MPYPEVPLCQFARTAADAYSDHAMNYSLYSHVQCPLGLTRPSEGAQCPYRRREQVWGNHRSRTSRRRRLTHGRDVLFLG